MDGCDDDESLFRSALEFLFVLPALIDSFVHSLAQLLFNIVVVGKSRTGHFHGFSLFVVCCCARNQIFSRTHTCTHGKLTVTLLLTLLLLLLSQRKLSLAITLSAFLYSFTLGIHTHPNTHNFSGSHSALSLTAHSLTACLPACCLTFLLPCDFCFYSSKNFIRFTFPGPTCTFSQFSDTPKRHCTNARLPKSI